jgi:type I site-specific restriction endonuclease
MTGQLYLYTMEQLALFTEKPHLVKRWQPPISEKTTPPPSQTINLRPYQKRVIKEVYNLIREGYKQPLIYSPTHIPHPNCHIVRSSWLK